jgi:hypothetical protein
MSATNDMHEREVEALQDKLKACEQSHADLKKTLDEAIKMAEFYASRRNYYETKAWEDLTNIEVDTGDKARQFLKSLEK